MARRQSITSLAGTIDLVILKPWYMNVDLQQLAAVPAPRYQKRFLVKSKQQFKSIRIEDIAGFFSEGRLIFMHTKEGKKYIVNQTMDALSEELLVPIDFFRVNRSMIIAFSEIKEIVAYFGGRLKVTIQTAGMKDILVSRERVPAFKRWLGE